MFELNQFALLDTEDALKNCGSEDVLIELLKIMMEELPADLERMKNAYQTGDYSMVETIAHKIKGGAIYVGTTRVKYACQYVESYWKSGQRELFDNLYHQAVDSIDETCSYVRDWLSSR
jgi:two-component system aerobic respiration control sensor histidine kinase ArcB